MLDCVYSGYNTSIEMDDNGFHRLPLEQLRSRDYLPDISLTNKQTRNVIVSSFVLRAVALLCVIK